MPKSAKKQNERPLSPGLPDPLTVAQEIIERSQGVLSVEGTVAGRVSLTAQNVAKNVIASATGKKRAAEPMDTAPHGSGDRVSVASVMQAVKEMAPTEQEIAEEEADSQWMEGLKSCPTGKKLCDFLGHVMSVLDDGNLGLECPIDQAVSFRRVMIRALELSPTPFNLPKKLPKFVAVVQLCGERMLLTTERNQLFQLLAHAPSGARANSDAINAMVQMIKYQKEHPEYTLLLTYSAPFQVDLAHL